MDFGEKLQSLRKQKNMTQEELANALYVSRTAISKWESGRGYPSIDSLKEISSFFAVSIDDLLSNNELLTLAENSSQKKVEYMRDLAFGLLDFLAVMLFFLPLFGQETENRIISVSLFQIDRTYIYMFIIYVAYFSVTSLYGILMIALQNNENTFWMKYKYMISLILSIFGTMIFFESRQTYVATFVFILLLIKGFLCIKRR